jgi:hypothetical protein
MVLNLSKAFYFKREQKNFNVDYLFTKEKEKNMPAGESISLVLNVSVNDAERKMHRISKPMATLYLSNEDIEKMVEEETVSFSMQ